MNCMDFDKTIIKAYSKLDTEQKERFFPGKELQAEKVIGSLTYLVGGNKDYYSLLILYITIAARIILFDMPNSRIAQTVNIRFSDVVPTESADTVIDCARRIVQNYAYLYRLDNPDYLAYLQCFDELYQLRFIENDEKQTLAVQHPDFGRSVDNPAYAHCAAGSYKYLNSLYSDGGIPLTWVRVGQCKSSTSADPIDAYDLFLPDGAAYCRIYINMYALNSSTCCPRGLCSMELRDLPG